MAVNIKISEKISKLKYNRIVIDTSVLIKAFVNEDKSDLVEQLMHLHDHKKLTLLSTPLLLFEFLNVISKNYFNEGEVEDALKRFFKIGIGLIDVKYGYLERAITAPCTIKSVSYYDSSYHALAKEMDAIFLTADEKYFNAMKQKGNIELL